MDYKIVVTAEAEEDLNQFIQYLLFAKKNKQAAKNVLDDFENTIKKLQYVASSLKVCENPRLQSLGSDGVFCIWRRVWKAGRRR